MCCAPERIHASETISTLRFGERASRIRNVIVRNEELSVKEVKRAGRRPNLTHSLSALALTSLLSPFPSLDSTQLQALLTDANTEIDRLQMVIKRLESGAGAAPPGVGSSGPLLSKSSTSKEVLAALALVNDDAFTKNLLDEVDRMGVEGEVRAERARLADIDVHCQYLRT